MLAQRLKMMEKGKILIKCQPMQKEKNGLRKLKSLT
jgi:hypothetical protein